MAFHYHPEARCPKCGFKWTDGICTCWPKNPGKDIFIGCSVMVFIIVVLILMETL